MKAYVLAGGESSRFGQNKALWTHRGKPLLQRLCEQLIQSGLEPVIVSKQATDYAESLPMDSLLESQCERLADSRDTGGPLAGFKAALDHCKQSAAPKCWILNCDLLEWQPEWIERMRCAREGVNRDIWVSVFATPGNTSPIHGTPFRPLPGLYDISSLSSLRSYLTTGGRSIRGWHESMKECIQHVPIEESEAPLSFNTLEEYQQCWNRWKARRGKDSDDDKP